MPSIKEVLKLIAGKTGNEQLARIAETEISEIQDDDFLNIKESISSLFTADSAANNPDIISKIEPKLKSKFKEEYESQVKKSIYSSAEEKIASLGEKFGVDLKDKRIDEMIDAIKAADPSKTKTKAYEDLQKEFSDFKGLHEKTIKEQQSQFKDYKVNSLLKNKMSAKQLADAYQGDLVKESIIDKAIDRIKSKAVIDITEKGEYRLLNPDSPENELFGENNQKLTLDDLINPIFEPYIKKKKANDDNPGMPSEITYTGNQVVSPRSVAGGITTARSRGIKY